LIADFLERVMSVNTGCAKGELQPQVLEKPTTLLGCERGLGP
jgi:hypothetical protein